MPLYTLSTTVIVGGNGIGDPSSNPRRGGLRFTFVLMPL